MKKHKIDFIEEGSIAQELEIEAGDYLVAVNGEEIEDVFDYHYLQNEEYLTVLIEKADGEEWQLEIEKDFEEDLGIGFANGLMDEYRSCKNKCIFCFIDQMPPGMRETLYFKDDDSRLSFLQGNYVTLTNLKEKDVEKIIKYKLAPINISVHTMNPALRCKMLNNRFAGDALQTIRRLYEAGITMNGQIVLCKDVNDKEELEYSLRELINYAPVMESVSVVPVGLSKYREGLFPLMPFTKEDAKEVLKLVHHCQKEAYARCGLHFIHASDEWYLLAGQPLPEEETYDGYLQLENGVGMLTLLEREFYEALEETGQEKIIQGEKNVTVVTGLLAAPFMEKLAAAFMEKYPQKRVIVRAVVNEFFGEMITVSGLLCGQDIVKQLKGNIEGSTILLPCNMLKSGEAVFLDDMSVEQLEKTLQVRAVIVKSNGRDLVNALITGGRKHG